MSAEGFAALDRRALRGDYEALAVLTIIDGLQFRDRLDAWVDNSGIDFAGILGICVADCPEAACSCDIYSAPYLSSGEELLVLLAANLWTGSNRFAVNMARLIDRCGNRFLRIALDAMAARAGGVLPGLNFPAATS